MLHVCWAEGNLGVDSLLLLHGFDGSNTDRQACIAGTFTLRATSLVHCSKQWIFGKRSILLEKMMLSS